MRKLLYIIPFILLGSLVFVFLPTADEQQPVKKKYSKQERIDGAIEDNLFTSSDVDLGYIPREKLFKAVMEGQRRLASNSRNRNSGSLTEAVWRERGPSNIGGRTRSIMIDGSDPQRNRVWVGGVSGGLWRTEDISQFDPKWEKLGIYFNTTSIGDIAQDPNDYNTIYVGTGESYTGDFRGAGLFKSTDDGETWTLLPSTTNSAFQYINEVLVHTNSDVYVATSQGGLFRSQDGGESWEKVLGTSLSGASNNEFHDIYFMEANQTFYASNDNSVFKSTTGGRGEWTNIGTAKPGFPTNLNRAELAVCPSDPDILYVLGAVGNSASNVFASYDGGENWTQRSEPGEFPGQDFTNGQAWYDLEIAVDPANCGRLLAGGVPMYESTNQAINWQGIGQGQIHVDHHFIAFDEKTPGRVFYGNDGGVWLSQNSGLNIQNRNTGYVTTQFYCAAIHPDAGSPYLLGGTQDNNSLQLTEPGLSPANSVWGGDGMFCFIDQNEPEIQIVSSQYGNYGLSNDGGQDFGFGSEVNGNFVNRSGYDDDANILYGQTNNSSGSFFRWNINTGSTEYVSSPIGIEVSAVKADPHVPNRVYFGGSSGRVLRVDNAHINNPIPTQDAKLIADLPGSASVSSVYMDRQTPNDILVTLFNYGASLENVWITNNGGDEWISIEGDLPDIPVRWGIFDPANHDRVMIATDAGIWTTDDVNGDQTHWEPTDPGNGMPFVRVDMLLLRESDKVVLAATHGRGLITTDVFSAPAPVIVTQPIAYEGHSVLIDGSHSVNAQSFEWNLGDNTISTDAKVVHTYQQPGTYTITLTINGQLTETRRISVLPYLPAPFTPGVADYSGDFENHSEHFAPYNAQGTGFQRGVSTKPGKDGTHSGANAWVLGVNDNLYENNTRAEFYTPMFDLSVPGLYELKFWSKYAVQNRNDGFQVEYSTDSGLSWHQLGSRSDPAWYNYHNSNLADGAFPIGKAYFTNAQLTWTQYVKDISFLGGEPRVAFRFVFKSDGDEPAQGLAIDDFEVSKYEGELVTRLSAFNADYTGEQEITVNWTTSVEYHAQKFMLERSFTGFGFTEVVGQLNATGKISTVPQNYQWIDHSLRNVIYYRLKVINEDLETGYNYEFYSDTIVVRRDIEPNIVHLFTNPFSDRIHISFSSEIVDEVSLRLFDIAGRLVREEKTAPNSVSIAMENLRLPPGVYVLSVQIDGQAAETYKLLTEGR